MELDHVLIAVDDLDAAAGEVEQRYGLASVEGGRHRGLGTANRIVPLGETYLELVAVVDESEAAGSVFGRWVAGGAVPRLLGWCVRTDELDQVAGRLELTVAEGARARPDGAVVHWRMAGLEQASREPSLPFFIEWGSGTPYPGDAPGPTTTIEELRIDGDPDRVEHWLGGADLPVAVGAGAPAIRSVLLGGEVVLDPSLWA
jgi:Glyoxalase-like domain